MFSLGRYSSTQPKPRPGVDRAFRRRRTHPAGRSIGHPASVARPGRHGSLCKKARRVEVASFTRSTDRSRRAHAVLSALEDRAWQVLDQGWELLEHRDRAAEVRRRHEAEGRVHGLFAGDDDLTRARCAEEIAHLRARYPLDPKDRLRSWEGWWRTGLSSCQPIQRPAGSFYVLPCL